MKVDLHRQFEQLIHSHRRILYKICNVYCYRPDEREDLAQEILVQLWHSFPGFDGRCLFSTWMYRVALNTAITFARRELARKKYVIDVEERVLAAIPERAAEDEHLQLLYDAIEELDPLHKALVLLYLDGNSHHEIAEVLGITPTNAATKIGRLKERLREKFAAKAVHERTKTP